jgi:hypothetical protein
MPLRFFEKGMLTLPDGSKLSVSFVDRESTVCIDDVVRGDRALVPVHLAGLCEDNEGKAWVGFSRYVDHQVARALYGIRRLPSDFDREHELLQCLEVEWLRVERVTGHCYTLCCSGAEFRQRRLEGSLPKGAPVKFCRYVISTERRCFVGERTVAGDPFASFGVRFVDVELPAPARLLRSASSRSRGISEASDGEGGGGEQGEGERAGDQEASPPQTPATMASSTRLDSSVRSVKVK